MRQRRLFCAAPGTDFIGIDEKRQRLLHVESAADCDAGVSSISQSLLQTYPHLQIHTDLSDMHVYIFAHWTLQATPSPLPRCPAAPLPRCPSTSALSRPHPHPALLPRPP